MPHFAHRFVRPAAVAALLGLAGCVGAPAPGPIAYTPGYPPNPAYTQPGVSQGQGYAPPAAAPAQQVAYSGNCYAGVYQCVLPQSLPLGAPCSCPGLGAPSYGNVR
jgi:hypothetical protein